jgi:hypothetical protein
MLLHNSHVAYHTTASSDCVPSAKNNRSTMTKMITSFSMRLNDYHVNLVSSELKTIWKTGLSDSRQRPGNFNFSIKLGPLDVYKKWDPPLEWMCCANIKDGKKIGRLKRDFMKDEQWREKSMERTCPFLSFEGKRRPPLPLTHCFHWNDRSWKKSRSRFFCRREKMSPLSPLYYVRFFSVTHIQ